MRPLSVFLRELQHRVMRANATMLIVATLLIAVLTLLAGCSTAVRTPAERTEEPAPMESEPTLLGTWRSVIHERDDDGNVEGTKTRTITLTGTHFFDRLVGADSEGNPFYDRDRAGTATVTGSTVRLEYHDDGEDISVDKEYLLVGDSLFIHSWESNEEEVGFEQFTRVGSLPAPGETPSTIYGTWQRTDYYDHREEGEARALLTLTFTATRAMVYWTATNRDGELFDFGVDSYGLEVSGNSVRRTYFTEGMGIPAEKTFFIGGGLLAIHRWWSDDPELEFDIFERVNDPLPGGVLDSWTCKGTYTSGGKEFHATYAFTFGESSFAEDFDRTGARDKTFDLAGNPRYDDENNFVFVTVQQAAQTLDGTTDEGFDLTKWKGHELRYAWAPTGRNDELVLSAYWLEQTYDDETMTWKDNEAHPYGFYNLRLGRQVTKTCWP